MKKLLFFMLALPLMAIAVSSCSDDDKDLPQVKIGFTYSNGVVSDGQVYVVQPDTLSVDSISVTAVRAGHVAACVGPVNYWLDGYPQGSSFIAPFGISILSGDLELGTHTLTVNMGIAEEGYALATAVTSIKINVVADSADIPSSAVGLSNEMPVDYSFQ